MTSSVRMASVRSRRRWLSVTLSTGVAAALAVVLWVVGAQPAMAAVTPVGLGSATSFAVLAGQTVTNTGPSVISGDLGVSPGSAVTGFPPGVVVNGSQHAADAVALQAQTDLTAAYNDAAGRTPAVVVPNELGGQTLAPGVYTTAAGMGLTGTVTLDGQGDPNAVFIFQAPSTLVTASDSTVSLVGGAQACNVFWQVSSSATLGTGTNFVGSVLALTSISVQTGAVVSGRMLARNGQVSLDTNTITVPACTNPSPSPGASTTATATTVIPRGHPETGAGGMSHSSVPVAVLAGVAALLGAGAAAGLAIRGRRRWTGE